MLKYKIDKDSLTTDEININFGVGEDLALNLRQSEIYNGNYVESVKNENISKTIDYEKQVFTPMVYTLNMKYNPNTGGILDRNKLPILDNGKHGTVTGITTDYYLTPINQITFNLFFREREYKTISGVTWEGKTINLYRDYGTWNAEDTSYWNNIDIETVSGKKKIKSLEKNLKADHLIHLGFDDDDVFYQKNALKKSFLRISIYDTPYRESQKLLHYSTIFFDTNKLQKEYLRACRDGGGRVIDDINNNYVCKDKNLVASFTCSNKFNNESCSDGFYQYLFDATVSGNTCTLLYMKVEFNNAKFGKTVPFIYPTNEDLTPIQPIIPEGTEISDIDAKKNRTLPIGYTYKTTQMVSGQTVDTIATNMKQLYNDMYIKIMVKFNYKTNSYVWFIPRTVQQYNDTQKNARVSDMDGNVVLNLYEPRINNED